MSKFYPLDRTDRKLLNLLQKDNQLPTRELADLVHVSQPTCLRRMRDLRELGIIQADVSVVDPFKLGYGLTVFLDVALESLSENSLADFEQRIMQEAEVLQCYVISGDSDFSMILHVADMNAYYDFIRRVISSGGNVKHFKSRFPLRRVKFSTQVQFDEQRAEFAIKVD
jgi:Lrp/AsnC family leucine-responsive transcriptional regulator